MTKKMIFTLTIFLFIYIPVYLLIKVYSQQIILFKGDDYVITEDLVYKVNSLELNETNLSFEGWVLYPGVEQGHTVLDNKNLWLRNIQENKFYRLKAKSASKRDTSVSFEINDGVDYQSAVFDTIVNLKELDIESEAYELYMGYQIDGKNLLEKTDYLFVNGEIKESR